MRDPYYPADSLYTTYHLSQSGVAIIGGDVRARNNTGNALSCSSPHGTLNFPAVFDAKRLSRIRFEDEIVPGNAENSPSCCLPLYSQAHVRSLIHEALRSISVYNGAAVFTRKMAHPLGKMFQAFLSTGRVQTPRDAAVERCRRGLFGGVFFVRENQLGHMSDGVLSFLLVVGE